MPDGTKRHLTAGGNRRSIVKNTPLNVGFLGAGYIATWHADALTRVPGVRLAAVCDLSEAAAKGFAERRGVEAAHGSLDAFLADEAIECVHVLTPPGAHFETTQRILQAGKHAFVEKPLVLAREEAETLDRLATDKGVKLAVNHNFLMLPGYDRFKRDLENRTVGPVDSFSIRWRFPLAPLRSGPFGIWMLREPINILFEIGSHVFAFAADLFDDFEPTGVDLRYPIEIPGGVTHYQGWRISGRAGDAAVTLDISLIEGHDDRSIEARGAGALARFDFANDSYTLQKTPMNEIVIGPFAAEAGAALQHGRTAFVNGARQLVSRNELKPYGLSITRACQSFYRSLRNGEPVDRRLSPALAARAISAIETAAARAAPRMKPRRAVVPSGAPRKPTMLVIGGTGFIGRRLCHALADAGYGVRVLSRGRAGGFERADAAISVFTGSLKSQADLLAAMEGIDGVFHLARAEEKSWAGYLENDVAVTRLIGEACLKAGVKRLVYTGTIDSYDASRPDRPITEETPFDHNLEERNLYARSKAACEAVLRDMAEEQGLALVIARPGIVIGEHGPLQHWGVAMWRGATACKLWGDGRNILPFVSVADAADGLVRAMTVEGIEGRSFNLIGEPLLTARDYFAAIGAAYGVRMRARPTPLWTYFAIDVAKYWGKRLLQRRKDLTAPSLRDWKSRAQLSPFRNQRAKAVLGWRPETNRARFIEETIERANLFGTSPPAEEKAAPREAVEEAAVA